MPKYLHLDIPEPCHEDWNKMTPETQGRFCGSCQKTVTDFTSMSDAQLLAFFKNPKPSVCGRFTQDQLERDLLIPRKRIPWVKYFFQFTLPAFLWSLKSSAQTMGKVAVAPRLETIAVEKPSKLLGDTTTFEKSTTIKGTVKDEEGKPVPYASVLIKGSTKGVVVDSLGNFSIDNVSVPCTVAVSSVGFSSTEVHLPYSQTKGDVEIVIHPELHELLAGAIVVVTSRKTRRTKNESKKEVCIKPVSIAPNFSIYPNPIKSSTPLHLQWQNLEEGNYRIEVYNTTGVLIKAQKLALEKGLKQTSLTINELLVGNYFVRLLNERNGRQLSQQFIVQE